MPLFKAGDKVKLRKEAVQGTLRRHHKDWALHFINNSTRDGVFIVEAITRDGISIVIQLSEYIGCCKDDWWTPEEIFEPYSENWMDNVELLT
jgi:hypothetical protein